MKRILSLLFAAIFAAFLLSTAEAQTRRSAPKKPVSTPKVVTSNTIPTMTTVTAGAQKVSIQIKNVTKFIYALGGIAQGIELVDADIKAKKASPAAATKNDENKKEVLQAIRNLRAGLAALEVEFRTNASLQKYLMQIQGITNFSAQSEDLAVAGDFVAAGKPLLLVVEKLSDTLAAMP